MKQVAIFKPDYKYHYGVPVWNVIKNHNNNLQLTSDSATPKASDPIRNQTQTHVARDNDIAVKPRLLHLFKVTCFVLLLVMKFIH